MPNCRDTELLLQDYLDGYLLPSQREVLELHVQDCPSCRTLLTELRHLDMEFEGLPEVEAPGGLSGAILESIPANIYHVRSPARHVAGLTGLLAAMVLLFVGGMFFDSHYGLHGGNGFQEVQLVFYAPGASSVAVVGDFNGWDSDSNLMVRGQGVNQWRATLKLGSGVYQYGFIIDGRRWSRDPRSEEFTSDGFGGENSLLFIEG